MSTTTRTRRRTARSTVLAVLVAHVWSAALFATPARADDEELGDRIGSYIVTTHLLFTDIPQLQQLEPQLTGNQALLAKGLRSQDFCVAWPQDQDLTLTEPEPDDLDGNYFWALHNIRIASSIDPQRSIKDFSTGRGLSRKLPEEIQYAIVVQYVELGAFSARLNLLRDAVKTKKSLPADVIQPRLRDAWLRLVEGFYSVTDPLLWNFYYKACTATGAAG